MDACDEASESHVCHHFLAITLLACYLAWLRAMIVIILSSDEHLP